MATLKIASTSEDSWLTLKSATTSELSKRNINDSTGGGQSSDDTQCPGSSNEGGGQSSNDTRRPGGSKVYSSNAVSIQDIGSDDQSVSPVKISQEPKRNLVKTARFADESVPGELKPPQHPSLQRDGPSRSKGSAQHEVGSCKPCAFFCFSKSGCSQGDACDFCHLYHESRSQKKREGNEKGSGRKSGENRKTERETSSGNKQQEQATHMMSVGNGAALIGMDNSPTPELFSYSTSVLLAAPGQQVETWPEVQGSQSRAFAVCPELPLGLVIDMHTGVIQGAPQEATDGPIIYFVTCCEPGNNFNISTAVVHVNVLNVDAQGFNIEDTSIDAFMPGCDPNLFNLQERAHMYHNYVQLLQL